MHKPKIAHITFNHAFEDTRIYKKEIGSLKSDFTVYYFTTDTTPKKDESIHTVILQRKKGRFSFIHLLKQTILELNKINDLKIIHVHDPILLLLPFLIKTQVKFIYDKHEYYQGYYSYHIRYPKIVGIILSFMYSSLEFLTLHKFEKIIQVSEQMPKTRFPEKEFVLENYPLKKDIILPDFKTRKNEFVFLGSINRYRGLHKLIKLLPVLPTETRFHIIGTFTDKKYETYLKSLPGWSKVVYHGYLSHDEAEPILLSCKIGVMLFDDIPNHRYSMPTKFYEYIQYGLIPLFLKASNSQMSALIQNLFNNNSNLNNQDVTIEYFEKIQPLLLKHYKSLL